MPSAVELADEEVQIVTGRLDLGRKSIGLVVRRHRQTTLSFMSLPS